MYGEIQLLGLLLEREGADFVVGQTNELQCGMTGKEASFVLWLHLLSEPKAPVRVQGGGKCHCGFPMISNMTEPILVKLSGIVEEREKNDLAKEIFEKSDKLQRCQFWLPCKVHSGSTKYCKIADRDR